jgi:Ca-activated chloride channel homolog
MHFVSALSLLGLPIIGGLIVVMYILKLKRKDVVVSSTYLWRQVIRDVQANAPFQKLRKNLLLLLQLIAAALIIFALARPFIIGTSIGGRNIVLIVDSSASMQSIDEKPSRIEVAKSKAYDQINNLKPGDRMMVMAASSRPEAVSGFTSDRGELRHAVDGIHAKDTPTNMRDALNLAADLVASRTGSDSGEILLISDGGFESHDTAVAGAPAQYTLSNLNLGKTHVSFIPVGKQRNNVGITAVDFRRNLGSEKKTVQLLVVTHNFSDHEQKFIEEIYNESTLVEAHELTLAANSEDTEPYDLDEPAAPTRVTVKLDIKDDLAVDNQASLILKPRKTLNVLLVGKENVFLENALKVDPGVELSRTAAFTKGTGYDVVVFNDSAPATLPEGNYLFLHCTSDQAPVTVTGAATNVSAADWERDDPVLRYVDFGTELFGSALKADPAPWGRQLAVAESGTLVASGEKGKMRSVFVGFDLLQTRFMLNVSFPILISDAVRWLGTGRDDSEIGGVRTGDALTIPSAPGKGKLVVTRPDGSHRDAPVSPQGGAVFAETDVSGIYTVTGPGGFQYAFAANLASASESDTAPRKQLTVLDNPTAAAGHKVKTNIALMPLFALLALAALCVEWWAFHRRSHLG